MTGPPLSLEITHQLWITESPIADSLVTLSNYIWFMILEVEGKRSNSWKIALLIAPVIYLFVVCTRFVKKWFFQHCDSHDVKTVIILFRVKLFDELSSQIVLPENDTVLLFIAKRHFYLISKCHHDSILGGQTATYYFASGAEFKGLVEVGTLVEDGQGSVGFSGLHHNVIYCILLSKA